MLSTASNANRVRIRSESKISETIANTDDFSFKEATKSGNSSPGCRVYLHNSDVIVSNCYLSPPSSPTTVSGIPDDSCDVRSRDSGRPMSLSSVTSTLSSRTSRGSDYFSSASTGENGQVTSYRHGTCDLPNVREIYPEKPSRRVQSCLHDSVREEEEDLNGEAPELPAVKKENGYIKHLTLPRNTNLTSSMKKHNAVSVRDINKKLSEVDHLSPVSTMAMLADPHLTYVDRIILELIETERMFVRALEDVLAGYILAIKNTPELPLSAADVEILFGNIKDIYVFNRQFLSYIENCDNDPVKIAACFVSEDVSFNSYTEYCTSYPGSVAMLTRCMKNPTLADFFKNQQGSLRHSLPLGSYLLKPVQRILKYHLILQELAKYCKKELDGYDIIQQALSTMTFIAHHINEMKRKHEDAVHVQEIQSLLTNWRGDDLTTYGELVMEGTLKLQGAKNERLTFLFDKMILITKRREDGFLVCKVHIMCSDLMLLESIQDNPLSFLILPFDNYSPLNHGQQRKLQYTLTARFADEKKLWTHNIKRLLIKNHHAAIPIHAQRSILSLSPGDEGVQTNGWQPTKNSRLSNISMDENKTRATLSRFGSTISPSGIGLGGFPVKTRRRSDSSSKKLLHLKALKRRDEVAMSDDVSSDSVPNTPSGSNKPRFSFPVPRLGGSKHDSPPPARQPPKPKPALTKKADPKYKDSVIYRRHKRRTSQPITFVEKRLSIKIDESGEGKTEIDAEDLDEFLNFNLDKSRESVSWDIQIVEAVFERFKKEETEVSDHTPAPPAITSAPVSLSVHNNQSKVLTSSDSSDNEDFSSSWTDKMRRRVATRSMRNNRGELQPGVLHKSDSETSFKQEQDEEMIKRRISDGACDGFNVETDHMIHRKTSIIDPNEMIFFDAKSTVNSSNKTLEESLDSTTQQPQSPNSLQRSNSANQNRRRYFERLKEMRDRRLSKRILGVDGLTIPQGKVQNIISQHRVSATDQTLSARSPNTPSPSISYVSSLSPTSPNTPSFAVKNASENPFFTKWRNKSESASVDYSPQMSTHPPASEGNPARDHRVRFRRTNIRSLDLESVRHSRLSFLTTASLPLEFTSSSSGDEIFEEKSEIKPVKPAPTFLRRSYSQDHGCTRRSRNLVIEEGGLFGASDSHFSPVHTPDIKTSLAKKVGNMPDKNAAVDKLSEQVDHVWKNLETEHPMHTDTSTQDESSVLSGKESYDTHKEHKVDEKSPEFKENFIPQESVATEEKSDQHIVHKNVEIEIQPEKVEIPPRNADNNCETTTHNSTNQASTAPQPVVEKVSNPIPDLSKTRGRHRARRNRLSSVESGESNMVAKLTSQFNHMSSPVKQQASQRSKSAGAGKHLQKYRYTGFKPTNELKLKFEQNCEVPSKPTPTSPEHTSVESPINLLVNKNSKPQCSHESRKAKSRYSLCSDDKPEQKSVIVKAEIQTEKVDKTTSIAAANEEKTSTVNTPFISQPVATTITLTTSTATSAISRTSLLLSKSSKVHSTPRKTYSYTPKYSPKLQKTVSDEEKVDFISMFCRKIETEE